MVGEKVRETDKATRRLAMNEVMERAEAAGRLYVWEAGETDESTRRSATNNIMTRGFFSTVNMFYGLYYHKKR
jgi:hypothetical protein